MSGAHYDTIIVGGGAAGCVLASRLSAQSARSVLLIEAGRDTPPGAEPADVLDTFASSYYNKSYMWPGLKCHWRTRANSPATAYDQARIMGGGSSVMVALRGTPADYAEWVALGADGWGWDDVLPYFNKLEHDLDFAGPLHGAAGPTPIRRTPNAQWAPLSQAMQQYADERQMPHVADMNGDFRDGYGSLPMSNTTERRASTAICYLDAAVRARKNLTIACPAAVTGFIFDGRRAVGVSAQVDGERREFRGTDIILCAGGVHSPAMLLRAGIGPAAELNALGIEVVADLPGVGRNLQNHALLFIAAHLRRNARQSPAVRPHPMTCFRYSSGFPGAPGSDMYIAAHSKSSWNALGAAIANFNATLFKPRSRGRVTLQADPAAPPCVEFNFGDDELDMLRFMDGFRRIVELVSYPAIRGLCTTVFPVRFTDRIRRLNQLSRANAIKTTLIAGVLDAVPGLSDLVFGRLTGRRVDLAALIQDRDALAEHVRQNVAGTFHVCGTCRMGRADDRDAVVDTRGRVRGLFGLRVVDASIMPSIPRGNTNIPTIMLAEKIAAEMVAEPVEPESTRTRTIDCHTHILGEDAMRRLAKESPKVAPVMTARGDPACKLIIDGAVVQDPFPRELWDTDQRLRDMDQHGVDTQVLAPTVFTFFYQHEPALGLACAALQNDEIAAEVKRHPTRFLGIGSVPLQAPELAASELNRAMTGLGLRGAMIATHVRGRNLDEPALEPFWTEAERLGAFIFIHPTGGAGAERLGSYYLKNLVGLPFETTIAGASLVFGGVLERHPDLKICLSHGGGFLPYQAGRFRHGYDVRPEAKVNLKHPPEASIARLFYDTILHSGPTLEFLIAAAGADHVLLGSDYPFDMGNLDCVARVEALGIAPAERDFILGGYADRILNIRA